MNDAIRCFIAMEIPENIKNELMKIQKDLVSIGADIKFVEKENLHFTLKFLGSVDLNKIEEVKKIIERVCGRHLYFKVHLAGIGVFPGIKHPKVIWAGTDKNADKIKSIYEDIESELNKMGFEKETRPFRAHVTMGRFRSAKKISGLQNFFEKHKYSSLEDFDIKGITFFQSALSKNGSIYTRIFEANLKIT